MNTFIKHDYPELVELKSIQDEFITGVIKAKENLLIQVLEQYLNRKPDIEDFKLCTLFTQDNRPNIEILDYNGIKLGAIITKDCFSNPKDNEYLNTFSFTFKPEITSF